MAYWPQRRAPARPAHPAPRRVSATTARLDAEFLEQPLGGRAGEVLQAPSATPPPPPPAPFTVEPPEWAGREADALLGQSAPPEPTAELSAIQAIKESEEGYSPEEPQLGPPASLEPLRRPRPPEPDWQAEAAAIREREAKERAKEEKYRKLVALLEERS